ncbi:hypothetical protein HRbin28_00137 [bacterium HR28]|nr:hypothetical protein HRbin28_00137 [bacterium HR28]
MEISSKAPSDAMGRARGVPPGYAHQVRGAGVEGSAAGGAERRAERGPEPSVGHRRDWGEGGGR